MNVSSENSNHHEIEKTLAYLEYEADYLLELKNPIDYVCAFDGCLAIKRDEAMRRIDVLLDEFIALNLTSGIIDTFTEALTTNQVDDEMSGWQDE